MLFEDIENDVINVSKLYFILGIVTFPFSCLQQKSILLWKLPEDCDNDYFSSTIVLIYWNEHSINHKKAKLENEDKNGKEDVSII